MVVGKGEGCTIEVGDKRPGLLIARGKYHTANPGMNERAGAHETRLKGDGQDGVCQAVIAYCRCGLAKAKYFGVTCGVDQPDRLIVGFGQQFSVSRKQCCTNGSFVIARGLARLLKGDIHERTPACPVGRLWRDWSGHGRVFLAGFEVIHPGFEHDQAERNVRVGAASPGRMVGGMIVGLWMGHEAQDAAGRISQTRYAQW